MISKKLHRKIYNIAYSLQDMISTRNKHFSFLIKRNKIICFGWNKAFQTHPLAARFGHRFNCTHSELDCINNFPYPFRYLSDFTLINVKIKNNAFGMAKPCPKCEHMLNTFGVDQVIYSTHTGEYYVL